jgi:NAD(P)-dependent dehydrogenase (short-subunit alcohol dehydrogenase family)
MSTSSSTPNVVLITGTSSGIGLHAALAAAQAGHTVVATMRNLDRSDTLRDAASAIGVRLDIRRLDVTEPQWVTDVVGDVVGDHGRLNALVNNAGAGHIGTIEHESLADVREVMELNFFGAVTMTRAALPHLRATSGRLLSVTSIGGVVGQPFNEAYCAAKFAVEGFMESLAPVAATAGVSVTVVEPAAVSSAFVENVGFDRERTHPADDPYADALRAYVARTDSAFDNAQSPEDAGQFIATLLSGDRPPFRVQTSAGARAFVGVKLADVDGEGVQRMTRAWVS